MPVRIVRVIHDSFWFASGCSSVSGSIRRMVLTVRGGLDLPSTCGGQVQMAWMSRAAGIQKKVADRVAAMSSPL